MKKIEDKKGIVFWLANVFTLAIILAFIWFFFTTFRDDRLKYLAQISLIPVFLFIISAVVAWFKPKIGAIIFALIALLNYYIAYIQGFNLLSLVLPLWLTVISLLFLFSKTKKPNS